MKRKKSIVKAYKRKWSRMQKSDRAFVVKFLGTAFLILVVVVILVCVLISHISQGAREKKETKNSSEAKKMSAASLKEDTSAPVSGETTSSEAGDSAEAQPVSADNEEVELLARLVNAEAGSGAWETQVAAASVILNRVQSDTFPDTIHDVIYQEGQYPTAWNGAMDQTPSEQAWESARYVYQNGSQIPANVLYQSGDVQGSGVWAQLDGDYFCYE